MTNPVLTEANLNKTDYAPGELMILTVRAAPTDSKQIEVSLALRDPVSGASSGPTPLTMTLDTLEVVTNDDSNRIWTLVEHTRNTFTLTASA